MKKIMSLFLLVVLATALAACDQSVPAAADTETTAQSGASLLPGYPQDVAPLCQPDTLFSCGFSYRENDVYDIGKDIYTVTFDSKADQKSLTDYYAGLLTEQNDTPVIEGDVITDQLNGKIGEYKIELMFLDNSNGTVTVFLTLGLPPSEYVDANPYFADYPSGLVDEYGIKSLQEVTYQQEYYEGRTAHYITVYSTDVGGPDFAAHYKDAYSSKQSFSQPDPGLDAFSWKDGEFYLSARYTGGINPYIILYVSKKG